MSKETDIFSNAPMTRAVLTLAVPTVISQLITVIYNMADTFFIGQLNDPLQVAAATIAMPVFVFLTAFANLFGIGGSSLISRSLGRGDRQSARQAASFAVWTGAAVSIIYGIIIMLSEPFIFPILGADEETWEYCHQYVFWTIGIGALPTVMNAELAHLIRAEGYSKQAGAGMAAGGVLNIILDPIFIFGFDLAIKGAAIATMLSNLIASLYFIYFIYSIRSRSSISLSPAAYSFRNGIPGELITVGLPGFIMTMMGTISNTVLNHIVAGYSNNAIAGMGIAKKIDSLAYAIGQGISQGIVPLIGYNYSSGNRQRMKEAIKTAFILSISIACVCTVILLTIAGPVSRLFIEDRETALYGTKFLKIIALACPSTMMNFMIISIFQAMGKKIQPFILSFLRKGSLDVLMMIPLSFFFALDGIAWATPLADWTALLIAILMFTSLMKASISNKRAAGAAP